MEGVQVGFWVKDISDGELVQIFPGVEDGCAGGFKIEEVFFVFGDNDRGLMAKRCRANMKS